MNYQEFLDYKHELLVDATDALRDYILVSARKTYLECLFSLSNAEHMAMTELEEENSKRFDDFPLYL